MKSKILILGSIVVFTISSYSFTSVGYASCFQQFRWCNALAESTFDNSALTEADQNEYVQSVSNCVSSFDYCMDPPQR
jgi:hypothetical protein